MQYDQSVLISAPPEKIFDYLTDQSTLPEWLDGVVTSEIIGGGPMDTGSKLRQVRNQGGKEMTGEVTVVAHERPYKQAVQCDIMGVQTTFSFELTPQANRTRVNLRSEFNGKGFGKLLEPVVGAMCRGCNTRSLENLKSKVEARNQAPAEA